MSNKAIFYSLKQGFKNIRRNRMFSLASVGTMVACLFLLGVFASILLNVQHILKAVETNVTITVFFKDNIDENRIVEIGKDIGKRPEVEKVKYISAQEAWDQFSKDYLEGDDEIIKGLGNDNPLADSDSYEITLKDIKYQNEIVQYLNNITDIRKVNSSKALTKSLMNINTLVAGASIAVIAILFAVSIFLISNTVTLGIAVRKEEIAIMKLIGATDNFVRGPFIVEGVVIGLAGAVVPLLLIYGLYNAVVGYVTKQFANLSEWLNLLSCGDIFKILIPLCLILGVGIGFFGSFFTVRKHLNV